MNKNLKLGILFGILILCLLYLYNPFFSKKIMKGGDDHIDPDSPDNPDGFTEEDIEKVDFELPKDAVSVEKDIVNCSLEEIEKYNNINNKWVYYNGKIYDITAIINAEYVNVDENIINTIKFLKFSKLQDLSKFLFSIEQYNTFINNYNTELEEKKETTDTITDTEITTDTDNKMVNEFKYEGEELKDKIFNKFKFIFIKSITQFKKGLICPIGLQI